MGAELVKQIRAHLYDSTPESPVYSLVNCADLKKVAFLRFAKDLGNDYGSRHLGVTVDQSGEPSEVHSTFTRMGIAKSGWYAHGTNIILPSLFEDTVRQAVDMQEAGQFNKVCEWTVNKYDSIDTLMTIGIDAILCDTAYTDAGHWPSHEWRQQFRQIRPQEQISPSGHEERRSFRRRTLIGGPGSSCGLPAGLPQIRICAA